MFYIGWKGLVIGCGTFVMWDNTNASAVPPQFLNQTFEEYCDCVTADVATAATSFMSPYDGECVHMDWNPWGYLNYTCLGLIVIFIIVVAFHIVKLSLGMKEGSTLSWQSGRFVAYTAEMQGKRWYKVVSYLFLFYTLSAVIVVLYVGINATHPLRFVTSQAQGLVLTIGGAFSFTRLHKASFAMHNDTFRKLKFKRGVMDLFNQSNDDLCKAVEQALYNAKWGDFTLLRKLVDVEESGIDLDNADTRETFLNELKPREEQDDQNHYRALPR